MRTLLLLRHAKSNWADATIADIERPLEPRGRKAARRMGSYLVSEGLLPDLILCSPAQRARETLAFVQDRFEKDRPIRIEKALYNATHAQIMRVLQTADHTAGCVMIIAHNPGMENLARVLAKAGNKKARRRMLVKYPTTALAVIRTRAADWQSLTRAETWLERFVCPRDLPS